MNDALPNSHGLPEAEALAKLQAQLQRSAQQVNADGSFELGWGTALLINGLTPFLLALLHKTLSASPWTSWLNWLPLACFALAPYGIPKLIKRFITWPRIGYAAYPNELKLIQLLSLTIMGAAIGLVITIGYFLIIEIRQAGEVLTIPMLRHGLALLLCLAAAVFFGRKSITKPRPVLPTAYDLSQIRQSLDSSDQGKKIYRTVRWTVGLMLVGIFVGVPLLVGAIVFGAFYLSASLVRSFEFDWPHLETVGLILLPNVLLYLMINAVSFKQHRWKWLLLPMMILLPIAAYSLLPVPVTKTGLEPLAKVCPPQLILSIGLLWFVSGAITLARFIRQHPLPSADEV